MSSLERIYLNVSLSWRKTFCLTWEKELYFLRELFTVFSSQKPNGSVSFKMQCHFGTKSQNISPRKCQWITFILPWIFSFGQTLLQHDLTFWIVSFPLRLPICKFYVPWKYFQPPLPNMQVLLRFVLASASLCKGTPLGSKVCPRLPPGLWPREIPGIVCVQPGQGWISCSQNACASLLCDSEPVISTQSFALPRIYTYLGPYPGNSCSCQ